jgi:hypothetical protein
LPKALPGPSPQSIDYLQNEEGLYEEGLSMTWLPYSFANHCHCKCADCNAPLKLFRKTKQLAIAAFAVLFARCARRQIPKQLLLPALSRRLVRLGPGNAGQHLIEGLFGRHFLVTAFVLPVFVFGVTCAATGPEHIFAHHGNNGVVR